MIIAISIVGAPIVGALRALPPGDSRADMGGLDFRGWTLHPPSPERLDSLRRHGHPRWCRPSRATRRRVQWRSRPRPRPGIARSATAAAS